MNRIRQLREEQQWTQDDLGKLLSVKRPAISKYENESIPLTDDTLKRLSEIFDVSIDYILGITNIREKNEKVSSIASVSKDERILNNLRKLREQKRLTQSELAKEFQISPSTIAMYERGERKPDPDMLTKIADFFNVSIDYLLGRNNSEDDQGTNCLQVAKEEKTPKDLAHYLENTEVLFNGKVYEVDDETRAKLLAVLEYSFWQAKNKK